MLPSIIKSSPFKWLLIAGGLGAAAIGPMAVSSGPGWFSSIAQKWTTSDEAAGDDPLAVAQFAAAGEPAPIIPGESTPRGAFPANVRGMSLAEVLRFDMTIREVMARWPRVSTSLPELHLQGYRVPLLTGTAETDLAGSLTYYFNASQKVQRISFQGTTGDGTALVQLLSRRFGFARRPTAEPNLFLYEIPVRSGRPASMLQLKLAPLLKASVPNQRFDVSLVIERRPPEPLVSRLLGSRG